MPNDFVFTARNVVKRAFGSEPGPVRYLRVPDAATEALPAHAQTPRDAWVRDLLEEAIWGQDPHRDDAPRGDVLVFIHGYNNTAEEVMRCHRRIKADLAEVGYKGAVLSFDWPCNATPLGYLEDRHDAKQTAMQLVTHGIRLLAAGQKPDCGVNVHLLCHSTGAYVVREAFADADDANLVNNGWRISQIAFIAGDVSSQSMSSHDRASQSIYNHCNRLTNYASAFDGVLKLSNYKRLGLAPRVGRVGLPQAVPAQAVNVDCSDYFRALENAHLHIRARDQRDEIGRFDHSWYIGNIHFARDLVETLKGDLDRHVVPTRTHDAHGQLALSVSI